MTAALAAIWFVVLATTSLFKAQREVNGGIFRG
jgi:hypothetical protein